MFCSLRQTIRACGGQRGAMTFQRGRLRDAAGLGTSYELLVHEVQASPLPTSPSLCCRAILNFKILNVF